ncbi:unnamed protein product [Mycena citricolor]|uniref:Ras-GAP domain-containing protein n=1 Tax=Mycena citricolor TaxID=2018698 RepID=A0AAD2K3W6_9AGAR|nr:unnamed protein product [Mycena citricolor]
MNRSRRPSVPIVGQVAGSSSAATSTTRVARSSDSNGFGISNSSLSYAPNSSKPQYRILVVLVNRLKSKLPHNSGMGLDELETDSVAQQAVEALVALARDGLDFVAWELSNVLASLADPHQEQRQQHPAHLSVELLQSQLFIMKVLAMSLSTMWSSTKRPASRTSTDSPLPTRGRHSSDQRSTNSTRSSEVLPLEDSIAQYILNVMAPYLRQTQMQDISPMIPDSISDISFAQYELLFAEMTEGKDEEPYIPETLRGRASSSSMESSGSAFPAQANTTYEITMRSALKSPHLLNMLLAEYAGRVIFHISASNWPIVFQQLRLKLHQMAGLTEPSQPHLDMAVLQLLAYSSINRERLLLTLQEVLTVILNIKEEFTSIAPVLRLAIWNWIDQYPDEFNETIRLRGGLEGIPERLFDQLFTMSTTAESNRLTWPALAMLNSISGDRLSPDLIQPNSGRSKASARPNVLFSEEILRRAHMQTRLSEIAMVCAADVCRVASRVSPDGEVPVRMLAHDIAPEFKSALRHPMGTGQKPFWDLDEIDVALYASVLTAIFRFSPEEDSIPLFVECLLPERAESVKMCAVRACLTLVAEAPRLPWQKPVAKLAEAVSDRLTAIFKGGGRRRGEVDASGRVQRPQPYPKCKRRVPQPLNDSEVVMIAILSLFRIKGGGFWHREDRSGTAWMEAALRVWESPLDNAVKTSTIVNFVGACQIFLFEHITIYFNFLQHALPTAMFCFSSNLLRARGDVESTRMWVSAIQRILRFYATASHCSDKAREVLMNEARTPAFILVEISLLVTLTSEDSSVSQLAAKALRHLAYLETLPGAPPTSISDDELLSKRHLVYQQLGDPRVIIVGRVGYQKRMRKLIRLLSFPSPIHVAVWQECYWRWMYLYNFIKDTVDEALAAPDQRETIQAIIKEKRFAYENLTLLLASLGGACVQDGVDYSFLTSVVPAKYLPDQMRDLQNMEPLVVKFVMAMTDQLVIEDSHLRENARNALGAELSPRLYLRLMRHFEETIHQINGLVAGTELEEPHALFVDQFSAVLRMIIDNTHGESEEIMSIDISATMLSLATFISRFEAHAASRLRLKFCQLCDALCERTDTLTLRKDNLARQKILDIIMEWMPAGPKSDTQDIFITGGDLSFACLRTSVKLLDRLPIQSLDEASTGDDSVHAVSRLFHKYSGFLLRGLNEGHLESQLSDTASEAQSISKRNRFAQREAELRELVITGLAHLVGSNSEHGFKQCLPLAYGGDSKKREIFANVFARVIGQGTRLDVEDRTIKPGRHGKLAELVKGSDMALVMAICETCPPSEVEMMISVLLNIFDTRGSLMALLKRMIDREVAQTESEAALFRSNSTCARFLSAFAKVHGYTYLRSLVTPLITTMASLPPGGSFELDPDKPEIGEERAKRNLENVKFVAASFLEIVTSSIPVLPTMFREICAHIGRVVSRVWPEAKFSAMGAFLFLRFISPAIVAPETIDIQLPKDEAMVLRRGLMIIAKIIQNLANNLFFGKEKHMVPLNEFLQTHIASITRFLSELHKYQGPSTDEETDEWLGTTTDDTDLIVLHRYFHKHADKIGKELLSLTKPADSDLASGKHAWDELCGLLVELGTPLDTPKLSSASSADHRDYIDLMARHVHKNVEPVKHLFLETDGPPTGTAVFVLLLSKIDVEALDIELLMYHIFKTLELPIYDDRMFDIVLDCTAFTGISELPLQYLKFCIELIPSDIRARFRTAHILNCNTLTQKYMRRLYNFAAGVPLCSSIRTYSSVAELVGQVSGDITDKLRTAVALESEACESFTDATIRLQQVRFPIKLLVSETHVRLTSVRAQPISPRLSCSATEIIPLADVSDVYNVSSTPGSGTQDVNEFIIRRLQAGNTLYFASPSREAIVKAIRTGKSRLKETPLPLTERFSRFSNIPATLLHVGMLTVDIQDEDLRAAGYELLGAVCTYLNFDKSPIVGAKSGFVPDDPTRFVTQLSEQLSSFVPQLTLDFVSEIAAAMTSIEKSAISQRVSCVQYLSPWIKNMVLFVNPTSALYERSGARVRDAVRVLCDMSTSQPELISATQRFVWSEVGKLDPLLVDVILDELVRAATDGGVGSIRCETIGLLLASMASINVRGKLIAKLRKSLGKTLGHRQPKTLLEYPNWPEISTLIRLSHVAGYQVTSAGSTNSRHHNLLYVPEILHLVTLTASAGPALVRKSVYGTVIKLLQVIHAGRTEESPSPGLTHLIEEFEDNETLRLFGLTRMSPTSEYIVVDVATDVQKVDNQEKLTVLLVKILDVAAGSRGLLNVWRARWMGLATSSAFQYSPAVQMRSFTTLGTLLTEDTDDDYLYQMLVALRTALQHFSENDSAIVITMLRSISKAIPALPSTSRYFACLFWLAVVLLESSHVVFYAEAARLMSVTLESMRTRNMFQHASVSTVLLEGRDPLEAVLSQFDQLLSISFDSNFSFALSAVLFKGMRMSIVRKDAEAVLRKLISVTMSPGGDLESSPKDALTPDALGYFIALLPASASRGEFSRLLKGIGLLDGHEPAKNGLEQDGGVPRIPLSMLGIDSAATALMAASFIGVVVSSAQGSDAESEMLYCLLAEIGSGYPEIVAMTYDGLQDKMMDVLSKASNPAIICALSSIFRISQEHGTHGSSSSTVRGGSTSTLSTVDESIITTSFSPGQAHLHALEDLGMAGIANSFVFLPLTGGHATKVIQWIPELVNLIIQ